MAEILPIWCKQHSINHILFVMKDTPPLVEKTKILSEAKHGIILC